MEANEGRAHVLMLVSHFYGHITPLIQFARRLAFKGIKVIMHSSKLLDVDKKRAKDAGADVYLVKPASLDKLLSEVNRLLFPRSG